MGRFLRANLASSLFQVWKEKVLLKPYLSQATACSWSCTNGKAGQEPGPPEMQSGKLQLDPVDLGCSWRTTGSVEVGLQHMGKMVYFEECLLLLNVVTL